MKITLKQGIDSIGRIGIGFDHEGCFVTNALLNPTQSELVDPLTFYGVSREDADKLLKLNDALQFATHAAVQNATGTMLTMLPEVTRSAAAELFFSDEGNVHPIAQALAKYLIHEVELNQLAAQN